MTQSGSSGTHTLIRGPDGTVVLFDEGGGANSAGSCKSLLDSLGIGYIDYAIASHYDSDHCGGLDNLITELGGTASFGTFYDRGGALKHDGVAIPAAYSDLVNPSGKRQTVRLDGSSDIDLGSGAVLRFLSVGAADTTQTLYIRGGDDLSSGLTENNKSISCLVSFPASYGGAGFDLYLGGDLEGAGEKRVDDVVNSLDRQVDVLLVDHHGSCSYDSNSAEFLGNLDPEVAVISVWNNNHGIPRIETVQNLQIVVEPDDQRIIRLQPGDTEDPNWAPETMSYCHTTNGHLKITTDGSRYTVSGNGISDPDLVDHPVDESISPTPPPAQVVIDSGDYNGDGTSDIAIFRGNSGLWSVRGITRVYYGSSSDVPIPGDYNGDGAADIGIFRPGSGLWGIRGLTRIYFGTSSDIPIPGDYNGDGSCDVGIFRPGSGLWGIRVVTRIYYGGGSDTAVPGDYNGDGRKNIAVFRPASGMWAIRGLPRVYYGASSDSVVPGDYNGDGTWEVGIFRPSTGMWGIRGVTRAYYGSASDQPVPADYDGNGWNDVGIFRGSSGLWGIRNITRAYYGAVGDIPVTR